MKFLILLSLLAAPLLGSAAFADTVALQGHAVDSGLALFGTLCSGEFECRASPLITRVVVVGHVADANWHKHVITKAHARKVSKQAHAALALIEKAKATCAQDSKSGQCTGDAFQANLLLGEAANLLAPL